MKPKVSDWDQESPFLGEVDDWITGDPIMGITYTGKNDLTVGVCRETRREDAIFCTLAEVAIPRQSIYLDALQRQGCLCARTRHEIEAILAMGA